MHDGSCGQAGKGRLNILALVLVTLSIALAGCTSPLSGQPGSSATASNAVSAHIGAGGEGLQAGSDAASPTDAADAAFDGEPEDPGYQVYAVESPLDNGFNLDDIAPYSGQASVEVNGNEPFFTASDLGRGAFEAYSPLDGLGRCGSAFALVGPETMPAGPRGDISEVHPSGWQATHYGWIDGESLYNRCHLIAYSLAAENANELNLITGTRAMNTGGMLPYEERTASYIDETGNHVLYRVTPVFEGDNLVASGVLMEAQSIEDDGAGVRFCVWCYNVQPGITIDYATGDNWEAEAEAAGSSQADEEVRLYVLNTSSGRFHYPDCQSVADMSERNKLEMEATRSELIERGYQPCGSCNP